LLKAGDHDRRAQVVAYGSFYDSLSPTDEPSYAISGGLTLGGAIPQVESALIDPRCSPTGPW